LLASLLEGCVVERRATKAAKNKKNTHTQESMLVSNIIK
jgi:hypothetical protein